jgi:hypothetical protein
MDDLGQQLEFTDNLRPQWHPRVPREKVRRLYQNEARGLVDEELIEEVGIALLLRCRSILAATEAHAGRAACARCGAIILHTGNKAEVLACVGCRWRTTWGAYFKTYQDKQLHGGGALFAFKAYADTYVRAASARERLLLIDRLLHTFHGELANNCTRPAACNLIGGKLGDVLEFLDSLTYGARGTPGLEEEQAAWREKAESAPWMRELLAQSRARRSGGRTGD